MSCKKCNDTGVIETGNNDFPCDCPVGDKAIFNVAGRGQQTGKEIKDEQEQVRNAPLPDYLK